jgi:hypothetical protein
MTRIVAFGIAVFVACSAAGAAQPITTSNLKEVHIDVGPADAPFIVTARVEDSRAAPIDLLKPAATADSPMVRLMKAYFQVFRAGDTKRLASLYEPHMRAGASEYFSTSQTMTENFNDLTSVRLLAVLHWGDYQFAFVTSERAVKKAEDGLPRWSAAHAAHCIGGTCQITDNHEISQLGGLVATAFGEKGAAQLVALAQGATTVPISPVADARKQPVATDPMILHLNRSPDETKAAAAEAVAPTLAPPWIMGDIYSFGADFCVALLKSNQNRAVRLVPLERAGTGWAIKPDPETNRAWWLLSSVSTSVALRGP